MSPSTIKHPSVTYLEMSSLHVGQRIDNFLLTHLKGVPRSHIYRILRTGEVRINKGRIKPTYRLQVGDVLRLPPVQYQPSVPNRPSANRRTELANAVLYEDALLLIINKPTGMAVHGGSGINGGVIEGLRALYPNAPYLELVHRLDRDTSGCLMIAKKYSMLRRLHALLREGRIHKQYLALVQGRWDQKTTKVEAPLRKNILQSGERIVRVNSDGKLAVSQFSIEQRLTTTTLLRVRPLTGRTHQIRVHAAYKGHPIAGDNKYGDEKFNQQMRHYTLKRLFLHAEKLDIALPEINYHVTVHAPLPVPLQQVLKRLEAADV
ncbi:MAG: 23S rRNA pseudouridine(955/2504/2580) synthase RluC [Candidatus Parabeggiatoa sp. nov. 3]|mgnify:CR=1 FL=1|nr:MAG: 23S rRNA pseudouridine(955/2504/2580) synthase RluC [Gammaproteobacteria bacterium]RKZ60074.1 MAG: 23S rRNA pseudouridine(955/2504/2580) synthase RluC [Gammaproteobacteria bacterium]RKZ73946.1 MAG: 23S rRNA pseudouridine(955/2504/2580) synthase RluC [Gammaproteobacteria bacterium]HEW98003.1 23S rRNA pseudouridine(955/2504/2580) synthase RluC [Beggiatoa sp.]